MADDDTPDAGVEELVEIGEFFTFAVKPDATWRGTVRGVCVKAGGVRVAGSTACMHVCVAGTISADNYSTRLWPL